MHTQTTHKSVKPQRRWDIDWLRIMAVLLLFLFHTARIFDIWEEFYVKNDQLSHALTYLVGFMNPWHMPLFFLLAGASTWFALRFRSGGEYVKERFKRLFIPFIFGVLVIVPLQSYLGLRSHSDYAESFWQWYPRFFQLIPDGTDYFLGGHTWGHLWFIFHLFVYSLAALPLFLYLNGASGQRLIDRLAAFFSRPGAIFLFGVLLYAASPFPDIAGGNPIFYILVFVYGFILMADARFGQAIDRHKAVALILGPGVLACVMGLTGERPWPPGLPGWIEPIVDVYYDSGFAAWFFLIAILGYGKQFLNFINGFLKYASEAAYPFYILHQTVIVVIGFYVVQWDTGVLVKFVTIVVASLVVTTVLYDLLVRRINVTRFLFGMRPKKKLPATPAPRPEGTTA